METTPSRRAVVRQRRLRGALLVVLLTVALAGLVELAARVTQRARGGAWVTASEATRREQRAAARLYRPHPYLVVAPRAGTHVVAFGKHAGWNSLGYRSPERPLAKAANVRRVLCAGGSTTFDLLAPRDEETWPWLLEGALAAPGARVEVWNAGMPGWTSLENALSFAVRDADLQPDLVVVFQALNDLRPGAHRPFDRQYERGHAALQRRALGVDPPPLPWTERSVALAMARAALGRASDPWQPMRAPREPRADALDPAAAATFERNLRTLAGEARAHGARVLLVTQRVRLRDARDAALLGEWIPGLEPRAVPRELERLDDVSRRLAAEGVALLADASREVAWTDDDYGDAMHFSPAGSRKLASYLAPRVRSALATPAP